MNYCAKRISFNNKHLSEVITMDIDENQKILIIEEDTKVVIEEEEDIIKEMFIDDMENMINK